MRKIDLSPSPARTRQFARMAPSPTDEDYRRLLELRTGLRRFLRWSEQHAEAAGLTPAQHQLLLAIRGHGDPRGPTVGDVAGYLMLRHHSAVGLVDRAEKAGLITRGQDPDQLSVVRLRLTEQGARRLEALSEQHLDELAPPRADHARPVGRPGGHAPPCPRRGAPPRRRRPRAAADDAGADASARNAESHRPCGPVALERSR